MSSRLPAEAIDNTDAIEPMEPIDRNEPTDPTERTDPFEPMERKESSDQRDRYEFFERVIHPDCRFNKLHAPARYAPTAVVSTSVGIGT